MYCWLLKMIGRAFRDIIVMLGRLQADLEGDEAEAGTEASNDTADPLSRGHGVIANLCGEGEIPARASLPCAVHPLSVRQKACCPSLRAERGFECTQIDMILPGVISISLQSMLAILAGLQA